MVATATAVIMGMAVMGMAVMDMDMDMAVMGTVMAMAVMGTVMAMAVMGTVMAMDTAMVATVTAVTDTTMGTMDTGITVIGTRAVAAGGTVTGMVMALGLAGFGHPLATFGPATEQGFAGVTPSASKTR
jgi:hypothetical protein